MGCLLAKFSTQSANNASVGSNSGIDNRTFTDIRRKDVDDDNDDRISVNSARYFPAPTANRHQEASSQVVKALWDRGVNPGDDECDAQDGELTFRAGELMQIIKSDDDWWLARRVDGSEEGYIPSNFFETVDNPLVQPWYHGKIPRVLVDKRLKDPDNDIGTFLVRESDNDECTHALSILSLSNEKQKPKRRTVKHYRIRYSTELGYYITTERTFETILDLITGYLEDSQGLCCDLTFPCPKQRPTIYDLSKENRSNPEIAYEDLSFTALLSHGNFGEVWKGKYKGRQDVAIKKLKEGSMPVERFLEEAMTMKTLRHERLVALLAVCSHDNTHYIISELLRESLLDFLKKSPEQPITNLYHIASQISEGMAYMESHNYIHRDLAARNVLMVDDVTVKIGDFGLARIILDEEDKVYVATQAGTKIPMRWTAPDAIIDGVFDIKSDVWAYGILLVELTGKGQQPYSEMKHHQIRAWLNRGNRHQRPIGCPEVLYNLMLRCWDADKESRPSFFEISKELGQILRDHTQDDDSFDGYRTCKN